ncbi:ribosome biogenesis protein [Candidatus Woesearchaeota archaeon]|nr:ribosome biogenesis protein [Candidatus Woesearchaeota archaeon]
MSKIEILRCSKCFKYTLMPVCNSCSSKAESPKPAKYSPHDPYGEWRLKYKTRLKRNGI